MLFRSAEPVISVSIVSPAVVEVEVLVVGAIIETAFESDVDEDVNTEPPGGNVIRKVGSGVDWDVSADPWVVETATGIDVDVVTLGVIDDTNGVEDNCVVVVRRQVCCWHVQEST